MMDDIQEVLKRKLIEHTQQVVARGGPAALTTAGRAILHYEPTESWFYEDLMECCQQGETYYPVAAVLAALAYLDLRTLQQDWNEALGQRGPLPLYLHPTVDGHYAAMMAETVVLKQLILLTDMCNAVMMAPVPHEIGEQQ
jgi:hypothetical protein